MIGQLEIRAGYLRSLNRAVPGPAPVHQTDHGIEVEEFDQAVATADQTDSAGIAYRLIAARD